MRLLQLSVAQGNSEAQYTLGELYEEGRAGLAKDDAEAVRLFKLAADQGDNHALDALRERGLA